MGKMLDNPKTMEKLAVIAAMKTGPDDNIAEVAKKVVADYFWAMRTIKEYNKTLSQNKVELKLLTSKKQKRKSIELDLVAKGI